MGRKRKLLEARVTTLEARCHQLDAAVQALIDAVDRGRGGAAAAKAAKAAKKAIVVPMPIPDREPREQRMA